MTAKQRKALFMAGGVLLLLAALAAGLLLWARPSDRAAKAEAQVRETVALRLEETAPTPAATPIAAEGEPSTAPQPTEAPTPEPYVSPVDFALLQKANPDIYGWLAIPGTEISYPLLQRSGDDEYYLSRNSDGQPDANGAIFTQETYNHTDMNDPATVVYGHHMNSGAMFGTLQETYSQPEAMERYGEIIVYLPTEEIRYQVFAAVPANKAHILYYYDFSDLEIYQLFLDRVFAIRSVGANFNKQISVSPDDKILILSTCLSGNSDHRYLVLAKRT